MLHGIQPTMHRSARSYLTYDLRLMHRVRTLKYGSVDTGININGYALVEKSPPNLRVNVSPLDAAYVRASADGTNRCAA